MIFAVLIVVQVMADKARSIDGQIGDRTLQLGDSSLLFRPQSHREPLSIIWADSQLSLVGDVGLDSLAVAFASRD